MQGELDAAEGVYGCGLAGVTDGGVQGPDVVLAGFLAFSALGNSFACCSCLRPCYHQMGHCHARYIFHFFTRLNVLQGTLN